MGSIPCTCGIFPSENQSPNICQAKSKTSRTDDISKGGNDRWYNKE